MVTRRKQHSSQRPVQQGPAVRPRGPIKSGLRRLTTSAARSRLPTAACCRSVGRASESPIMHKILCTSRTHWNHVTSERGFAGREGKPGTEKPKDQLPSFTTANPTTEPHSQFCGHNSGRIVTPRIPVIPRILNCSTSAGETVPSSNSLLYFDSESSMKCEST